MQNQKALIDKLKEDSKYQALDRRSIIKDFNERDQTNFDLIGFIKNWYAIFKLPSQNKRKPISNKAF